jgi:hypothetical protein
MSEQWVWTTGTAPAALPLAGQRSEVGEERSATFDQDRPRRARQVVERVVDGDLVLYDPQRQRVHVLNPTAAFVWSACDGQLAVEEIVDALGGYFPAWREQIAGDVRETVQTLRDASLLEG